MRTTLSSVCLLLCGVGANGLNGTAISSARQPTAQGNNDSSNTSNASKNAFEASLIVPTSPVVDASPAPELSIPAKEEQADVDEARVYHMKKCKGAGCPYTASWLSHINLYRRVGWFLESTKMETASFNIFDKSHLKFQLSDPDAYYVHHMSMFEHLLHKKHGFEVAKNRTSVLSSAALRGECSNLTVSGTQEYLALIPFYGGLPPDVTADYSKVQSIGQGNSLVDPSIKVKQCMATLCSCLRYFGHAVIAVTRTDDRELIAKMLNAMHPRIKKHTHVIQLALSKPAHLPFHLLAWGQKYVQEHNCKNYSKGHVMQSPELYQICSDKRLESQHRGGPVNVTHHRRAGHQSGKNGTAPHIPIRYVYYTEMDQVVRFDSPATFHALSRASNESCFFVGRRREKNRDSDAEDYMGTLDSWRECGEPGYSLSWPDDLVVRTTNRRL